MPTTIGSLVVFVAFLTPGFVYLTRLETRFPSRKLSVLRETATVVSASLLFNVISGGAFAAVRTLWPGITPDVGMFIRAPLPYFQEHYASVLLWAGAVFAISVGLAALWGVPPRWSHTLVEMVANLTPRWQGPLRDWSARRRNRIISSRIGVMRSMTILATVCMWVSVCKMALTSMDPSWRSIPGSRRTTSAG